jgi:hypothetical protein
MSETRRRTQVFCAYCGVLERDFEGPDLTETHICGDGGVDAYLAAQAKQALEAPHGGDDGWWPGPDRALTAD